jgi:hypothetical protein
MSSSTPAGLSGSASQGDSGPVSLGFLKQPAQRAGRPLQLIQVGLFDAQGELVDIDGVVVHLDSPEVELLGETTAETVGGVATFSNVYSEQAGTDFTIVASADGFESVVSNRFTISPGDPLAPELLFKLSPHEQGEPFNFQLELKDEFGNPVAGQTVQVEILEVDSEALVPLSGETTVISDGNGLVTFDNFSAEHYGRVFLRVWLGEVHVDSEPFSVYTNAGKNWRFGLTSANLKSVCFANRKHIAVGDAGTILTLEGSELESSIYNHDEIRLNDIEFAQNLFVVVGDEGKILTSPDGITWTERDSGTSRDIDFVTHGNGVFVATGAQMSFHILTSSDGINWTVQRNGSVPSYLLKTYWTGDQFVANGPLGHVYTSTDGISWTRVLRVTTVFFNGAVYGAGLHVGVYRDGTIRTSTDTTAWDSVPSGTTEELHDVLFEGGRFLVVGANGTVLTSPDGLVWTTQTTGYSGNLLSVSFGDDRYVAVGENGAILSSVDGVSWVPKTAEETTSYSWSFRQFVEFSGQVYGVGEGVAVFSDPLNFQPIDLGFKWGEDGSLAAITHGQGLLVAVGSDGLGGGVVLTSPDGANWSLQDWGGDEFLTDVIFHQGNFVAIGTNGTIVTSSDGVTWEHQDSGLEDEILADLTAKDGVFVVTSVFGKILTSTDRQLWTVRDPGVDGYLFGASSNGERFIVLNATDAGGGRVLGRVLSSTDGVNWETVFSGEDVVPYYAIWAGEKFLVAGIHGSILTSPDGLNWKIEAPVPRSGAQSVNGLGFFQDTYVVPTFGFGLVNASQLWVSP